MGHADDCQCRSCNPVRCIDCGIAAPWSEPVWRYFDDDGRCKHRRACEARQMLTAGVPSAIAAAHAQGITQRGDRA